MINPTVANNLIMPNTPVEGFKLHSNGKGGQIYGVVENGAPFGISVGRDIKNVMDAKVNIWRSKDKSRWFPILNDDGGMAPVDVFPFYHYCDLGKIVDLHIEYGFTVKGFTNKERTRLGAFFVPEYVNGTPKIKFTVTVVSMSGMVFVEHYDLVNDQWHDEKSTIGIVQEDTIATYKKEVVEKINKDFGTNLSDKNLEVTMSQSNHYKIMFDAKFKMPKEAYAELLSETKKFNASRKNPLISKKLGLKNLVVDAQPTQFYKDMLVQLGKENQAEMIKIGEPKKKPNKRK